MVTLKKGAIMFKSWIGGLSLIFVLGCATGRVIPSQELALTVSNPESTILLFAIDTSDHIKAIHISGPSSTVIEPKPYQFIELSPGEYEITKLEVSDGYFDLTDMEHEIWNFRVKSGAINYVGHFQVKDLYDNRYSFSLENKSTLVLEYLEINYANFLDSKKLFFGGLDSDNFFDFVDRLRSAENE
jgi:hypothetical protein